MTEDSITTALAWYWLAVLMYGCCRGVRRLFAAAGRYLRGR